MYKIFALQHINYRENLCRKGISTDLYHLSLFIKLSENDAV